jgi:predicted lipid-binding transport protein (Tim44 family)
MGRLESTWVNVVAGVIGGLVIGLGIGRLAQQITVGAIAWTVMGMIILWWAFSDKRKYRPGNPESETEGSHTIE